MAFNLKSFLHNYWRFMVLVLTPILLSPLIIAIDTKVCLNLYSYFVFIFPILTLLYLAFQNNGKKILFYIIKRRNFAYIFRVSVNRAFTQKNKNHYVL